MQKRRVKNQKYMSTTAVESPSEEEVRIGQKGWVKKDIKKKKMNSNPPMYKNDQSLSVIKVVGFFLTSRNILLWTTLYFTVMRREYPWTVESPRQTWQGWFSFTWFSVF